VAKFINPEMCEITEDLFFNDPYQIHERNNYPAELENDVAALRDDAQLKLAVASLKHRFFSHAEALLHGDIHSGSIFVADGSLKAIDAEFGYFGPIGLISAPPSATCCLTSAACRGIWAFAMPPPPASSA
jgi:5-methylthioribose kinase